MVLMVPWAVFAAVVAMSVPQRMAAESSMRSATEDLAALHEHHDLFSGVDGVSADGGLYSLEGCAHDPLGEAGDPVCLAVESVFRDLGAAGVDVTSLRGFYADGVDSAEGGDDSDEASLRWSLCAPAADAADPDSGVYVALVADWTESGWAVSQVWPEGRRVGGEALESRRLLRSAQCPEGMAPIDPGALGRSGRLSG